MNTPVPAESELGQERSDQPLDEAFRLATGGAISSPNVLQHALFPRLLTQDTGLLVPTGTGAGRLEAVFVPLMVSREDTSRYGLPRQRLFIIAADGNPLDDYYERLGRYLMALAADAGEARTLFIASEADGPVCERYMPDGAVIEDACDHPLDPGVDLAVAPFSHFRSLFFGAGGIHVLPQSLLPSSEDADMRPRDLFYFDEALGYTDDESIAFLRLVEFLFTQDMDLVVGSSTLPRERQEELGFLEPLVVAEAQAEPPRTIQVVAAGDDGVEAEMARMAERAAGEQARVVVCADDSAQSARLYQHLSSGTHQNVYKAVYRYDTGLTRREREEAYFRLRALDDEGSGYLVVTDGPAVESSDLSADLLISGVCQPESLIRRAGRVNRRGSQPGARIVVVGDRYPAGARPLAQDLKEGYEEALASAATPRLFQSREWKPFIA